MERPYKEIYKIIDKSAGRAASTIEEIAEFNLINDEPSGTDSDELIDVEELIYDLELYIDEFQTVIDELKKL